MQHLADPWSLNSPLFLLETLRRLTLMVIRASLLVSVTPSSSSWIWRAQSLELSQARISGDYESFEPLSHNHAVPLP